MELANILKKSENFSLTRDLTDGLSQINNSRYAIAGPICSRVLAFCTVPFVSLTDAAIHTGLCGGKALTGVFVTPYNCLAKAFYPQYAAPEGLELSSALIHLMRVVENVFNAAVLTVLCVLFPDRAHAWMNERQKGNFLNAMHSDRLNLDIAAVRSQALTVQTRLEEKIIGLENIVRTYDLNTEKMKQRKIDLLNLEEKNNEFGDTLTGINQQMSALRVQINEAEIEKARINQEKIELQSGLQAANQLLAETEQKLTSNKKESLNQQTKIRELEQNLTDTIYWKNKITETKDVYFNCLEKRDNQREKMEVEIKQLEYEIKDLREAVEKLKFKNSENEKARVELTALNRTLLDKIQTYSELDDTLTKEDTVILTKSENRSDEISTLRNLNIQLQADIKKVRFELETIKKDHAEEVNRLEREADEARKLTKSFVVI